MTLLRREIGVFGLVLILLAFLLNPMSGFAAEKSKSNSSAKPAKESPATETNDDLPAPELTLGARAGDGVVESYGDILAPIMALKSGIVFINPRASMSDHSAEEYNLGLGYRHLLKDKGMILGANVYYDYRETESGGRFNQLGLGVEYLSDWVDARANYYLPEDHTETVHSEVTTVTEADTEYTRWDDPYATGNSIYQNGHHYKGVTTTWTTQHFVQYEEAMEGWDCELGVRLPIPTIMDYADVKVFGGYYRYNRDFGLDDLDGFKGRLEIKTMPSLYLDAEVFDSKDLTGHDFYLGARVSVPFDVANISKGRNPFKGALDGLRIQKQKNTIASRLTEMVMRDLHVQTDYSTATEEVSNRTSVSTTLISSTQRLENTLATDVIFVNQDTGNDTNPGTVELPVAKISTGIARGSNVFVMATVGPYLENLQIGKNVNLMGQGFPIGSDGKYLNGDSRYAVIKGLPYVFGLSDSGPTIMVLGSSPDLSGSYGGSAESVQIRGFDIQNEISIPTPVTTAFKLPASACVLVDNVPNFELAYNKLDNALIGFGGIYDYGVPTFTANIHNNTFDNLGLGAGLLSMSSQGNLIFSRNTIQNTAIGLAAVAAGSNPLRVSGLSVDSTLNAVITDNLVKGGSVDLSLSPAGLDSLSLLDLLPVDIDGLVQEAASALSFSVPSLSALNVIAYNDSVGDSATVNAWISGNSVESNLLGIGVVAFGDGASVNANIQNNTLLGGGLSISSGDAISSLSADDSVSGSLLGIWMLAASNASIDNAVVANNTIKDHAVGIAAAGLLGASMDSGSILNNTISDSLLGIIVAGYSGGSYTLGASYTPPVPRVTMNDWTISGNRITGNGLFQIADLALSYIPVIPPEIREVIEEINLPDTGVAGIAVVGIGSISDPFGVSGASGITPPSLEMNRYTIAGNTINNEIVGIGVFGMGGYWKLDGMSLGSKNGVQMNDYMIAQNSIQHTVLGIGVGGYEGARIWDCEISQNDIRDTMIGVAGASVFGSDLSGFRVSNNTIVGGDLDDLLAAVQPLVNTNIISNPKILDILTLPLPETGGAGVVVANYDADMYDISINGNAISKNIAGILVGGLDYADMDGIVIENNTINDSVLGIAVLSAMDEVEISDGVIRNNVINDPVIGIMALTMDDAWMNNWTISGNQVNRSLIGILAAASDGSDMTNLTVSANTISGANDPFKVALMTRFMLDTSLFDDMEDVLDMDWNPALFPSSGLIGIVVSGDHAGEMGSTIVGNQLVNEAIAGTVNLERQPSEMPIGYFDNTSDLGQYYVQGTNYVLSQSGNVPSPVIEIP